jgi:hypothetical protein
MAKENDDHRLLALPEAPDFDSLGGLCLSPDVDRDLFHPDKESELRLSIKVAKQQELAIAICNNGAGGHPCPARDVCRQYGRELADILGDRAWGIFGGEDIRQHRKARKAS